MKAAKLATNPTAFAEALRWAETFWNVNSVTTPCIRRRDQPNSPDNAESEAARKHPTEAADLESAEDRDVQPDSSSRQKLAEDLLSSYVEALETSAADLYCPERQEVHAGLVFRAGRELIAFLGTPELWCTEFASNIGRMLVEVRIYLTWMALQDPSIYRQFQEYGRGKAKLYSRISKELPEGVRTPAVQESIDVMSRLSRNGSIIDHRVVDTRDSFADGKSLRAMAEESGLIDLYRHAYMTASGIAHSEWWSVEMHAMEQCLNILHRGHLIPSLSLGTGGVTALADAWIESLYALIRLSLEVLEPEPESVRAAFDWMDDSEEAEDAERESSKP
jgi:hypothetical protein